MSKEFTYSDIAEHNTKKVSRAMRELLDARKTRMYTKNRETHARPRQAQQLVQQLWSQRTSLTDMIPGHLHGRPRQSLRLHKLRR